MDFSFFTYLTIGFWKKNQSLFYFVPTALEINYTSLSTNILSRWDYENLPRRGLIFVVEKEMIQLRAPAGRNMK